MKPPTNALIEIKQYCKKTQCATCDYGQVYNNEEHYVSCTLIDTGPYAWYIKGEEYADEKTRKKKQKTD